MGRLKQELWTFGKAQMTALIATLVDFCTSVFLAEILGFYYVMASFLGSLTGGIINCGMNYRWVFEPQGVKKKNAVMKYMMVWCGSILLNTLGTYALTEFSRQYFIIAKAVVAAFVAVFWNYQLQRHFVYQKTNLIQRLKMNIKSN